MKQMLSALTLLLSGLAYAAPPQFGPVDAFIVNDDTAPVPSEIVNDETAPVPAKIVNDETAPVPSKNVNEPGREPYNQYIEYGQFGCGLNCTDFVQFGNVLLFNGPTVPMDKRLVVRWVSGAVPSSTPFNSISFQEQTIIANQRTQWQYYGPYHAISSASTLWGMSSGAFFTVEPGEPLRIRVAAGSITNFVASISVGGYLVDAE